MSIIDTDILIDRIRAHFPVHPMPIVIGEGAESYGVNSYFSGRTWPKVTIKSISEDGIDDVGAYLTFMTDEAFRYYLPAYMLMPLIEYSDDNSWIIEKTDWHLIAYEDTHNLHWRSPDLTINQEKLVCFDKFLPQQKTDIADYLFHQIHHRGRDLITGNGLNEDASRAFNSYWYQFASSSLR